MDYRRTFALMQSPVFPEWHLVGRPSLMDWAWLARWLSRWWWWRTPEEGVPALLHLLRVRALSERPVVTDNKRLRLVIEGRVTWPPAAPILATNLLSRQPTPPPKTLHWASNPGIQPLNNEIQEINTLRVLPRTNSPRYQNTTKQRTHKRLNRK